MAKGQRLDLKLMEMGLFSSRQEAQAAIMDGGIFVDGEKLTKAGTIVGDTAKIEVGAQWQPKKYVSRGGLKLEKALLEFNIACKGRIAVDLGASTGGFTDCLLKHQAAKVYAIDVGYGQLAWSLRTDSRVIIHERVNARTLAPAVLYKNDDPWATLAVMDLSFISLTKVLPGALTVLDPKSHELICLIKPQFEAGKSQVGKGGVIRSSALHKEIIASVLTKSKELGLSTLNLTFSPVKGPAGNIEYLVHLSNLESPTIVDINGIVDGAFLQLNA